MKILLSLGSLAGLILAGCASAPSTVTYQVPLGPAQASSDYGTPNLAVNAVHDVSVTPGQKLYYQIVSPVNTVLYVFDKDASPTLLSQLQGTTFYSSVVPSGHTVEFVFSATIPVTSGSAQLTLSDGPLASGTAAIPYTSSGAVAAAGQAQPAVMLSPSSASVAPGQSVTFTASGGAGGGGFVWGGAAGAAGWSNVYTFNAPGTYTVNVYRAGDGSFAQSNTASAVVTVASPAASTVGEVNPAVTVTPAR